MAHPRVCGENWIYPTHTTAYAGSSPRVRGKRMGNKRTNESGRLIPACAGKTSNPVADSIISRAHPRVCGENYSAEEIIETLEGSSPRVRGKHGHRRRCRIPRRLIPACAGKTA